MKYFTGTMDAMLIMLFLIGKAIIVVGDLTY